MRAPATLMWLRTLPAGVPGGGGGHREQADWLRDLLGALPDEVVTDAEGEHRYAGARFLYTSGCRFIDATAGPLAPGTLRLTFVWTDDATTEGRARFLAWWEEQARSAGWEPTDDTTDDGLYGDLFGQRFVVRVEESEASEDTSGRRTFFRWSDNRGTGTSGRRT